jgi:ribosomal subunit interface protein
MQTQITFRHLNTRSDLQEAAIDTASKFERFHDGITSTNVEFIHDNASIVEFRVNVSGSTLIAREQADSFNKSLTSASEKMIRQLKKLKTKMSKPV